MKYLKSVVLRAIKLVAVLIMAAGAALFIGAFLLESPDRKS